MGAVPHEETMKTLPLGQLMAPRSVAIVGVSQREDALGTVVVRNLQQVGFGGTICGVNPRYSEAAGIPCYPSLADVPGDLDAVFLAVPASAGPDLVDAAAARGVKALFMNASGYADGGAPEGRARQERIKATAAAVGMVICGPNNTGIINLHDRVAMWTAPLPLAGAGPVAVIAQSGSASMVLAEGPRDLGLGYAITCGNEAVATVADYLDYVVRDDRIHLVVLFIETIRKPDLFAKAALEAARRGTRILALKIGRSESGKVAVMAHTGSIAGEDSVYDAFFRRYGIVRASDLDELIELSVLFGTSPEPPPTPHIVPITFSGGEAALVADIGTSLGLSFPPVAAHALDRVREALPPFAAPRNPLDAFGLGFDPSTFASIIEGLLLDEQIGVIVPAVDAPSNGGIDAEFAVEIANQFVALAPSTKKRLVLLNNSASSGMFQPVRDILRGQPVPFLTGMREGLLALQKWAAYAGPEEASGPDLGQLEPIRQALSAALNGSDVDQFDALAAAGLPMVPSRQVASGSEALRVAEQLGYPCVLKGSVPGMGHKSEAGLVRVGLRTPTDLQAAFDELNAALAQHGAGCELYLQPMAGPGVELIVGVRNDPAFGTVVVAGLGGIFVEVLKDISVRLGPIDAADARAMLAESGAGRLLEGFRGAGPYDIAAASDAIARLSLVGAATRGELKSIEINPLIVLAEGRGVVGVDALIE